VVIQPFHQPKHIVIVDHLRDGLAQDGVIQRREVLHSAP
jgi:hypothetical protein